jgi:hypothetical protein
LHAKTRNAVTIRTASLPESSLAIGVAGTIVWTLVVSDVALPGTLVAREAALVRIAPTSADGVAVALAGVLAAGALSDGFALLAVLDHAVAALGLAVVVVVGVASARAAVVVRQAGGLQAGVFANGLAGARVLQLAELAAHGRAAVWAVGGWVAGLTRLLHVVAALDAAVTVVGAVAARRAAVVTRLTSGLQAIVHALGLAGARG